ncbi:AimR family lysis-lysogeny pheromone receptor, partial [Bacillus thuringiensis]|nr:AimR family lysis-lysogeny pheromone receptor [Bacillus thuringiensis]
KDIERKKKRIKSTIIFLKIHHYRDLDTLPDILDDDDQAYLEFKRGNYQASESILLKMKETKGYLNEFQTLFLGLARNDRELIEISHRMFIEKKSLFYANLPKIYLG